MLLRRLDKLGKAGITISSDIFRICAPYLDSNELSVLHINNRTDKITKDKDNNNNRLAPISITITGRLKLKIV